MMLKNELVFEIQVFLFHLSLRRMGFLVVQKYLELRHMDTLQRLCDW